MELSEDTLRDITTFVLVGLLLVTGWLVWLAADSSSRELRVSFLDVGQGDAVLLETPSGTQALIDAGRSGTANRPLSRLIPFYDRSIDMVVGTHADSDHIGGLPQILDEYRVDHVLLPARESGTASWEAFLFAVQTERTTGARLHQPTAGDVFRIGPEVFLIVLSPSAAGMPLGTNQSSLVLKLVYGQSSLLLTGDIPQNIERYLTTQFGTFLNSDILKVAHHGSDSSSGTAFVSAVSPATAVISAGADNAYGHPHQEVLARLKSVGSETICTCKDGSITFVSDGRKFERLD